MNSIKKAGNLAGKNVFVRADLDVPVNNGQIEEEFRLDSALPTLNYLKEQGANIFIAGHMGRPKDIFDPTLSTKQLNPYFDMHLGEGAYTLLENLRFDSRENELNMEFAQELAQNMDIYVNESFATSHREATSIVGVPKIIPGFAGLQLSKEVSTLSKIMNSPKRPFVAIVGGAKVETKKPAVMKLLEVCDKVLVGGRIGLDWNEEIPSKMVIPVDYARDDKDVGPKTLDEFSIHIENANTILWAGPLGAFEQAEFSAGTSGLLKMLSKSTAFTVAGGGDTVSAINSLGNIDEFDFVSTGGGAMLDFIIYKTLPGLEVLDYHE